LVLRLRAGRSIGGVGGSNGKENIRESEKTGLPFSFEETSEKKEMWSGGQDTQEGGEKNTATPRRELHYHL